MSDPVVLPDTSIRVILALGEPTSRQLFPSQLFIDDVDAWEEEDEHTSFHVTLGTVELHTLTSPTGEVDIHYHVAGGEPTDTSPLDPDSSAALLGWAMAAAVEIHGLIEDIEEWAAEAADNYMVGNELFAPESEDPDAPLEQLHVALPGLTLNIPWLGAGEWVLAHEDGSEHAMNLEWAAEPLSPIIVLARARLNELTGEPIIEAADHPGADIVGLTVDDVTEWLAATYTNHLRWHDAHDAVATAVIDRVVGMRRPA